MGDENTIRGMASSNGSGKQTASSLPAWRRFLGLVLFVVHLILPLLALIIVPLLGLPDGVNTVLVGLSVVGGPDVLLIASIALLGKDGIATLVSKLGKTVKRLVRWDAVTKTRYTVLLWVALVALVLPALLLFFWTESIVGIGGAPGWGFWVLLGSTVAFIGAVIGMGEPLWTRIEALVTWDAQIVLPEERT